jgi:hypothetical protein
MEKVTRKCKEFKHLWQAVSVDEGRHASHFPQIERDISNRETKLVYTCQQTGQQERRMIWLFISDQRTCGYR